jgi:hypothetical protein
LKAPSSYVFERRQLCPGLLAQKETEKLGENATATKHGFDDGSSINEPELSSQSDAINLELQAGLPPTVESRCGIDPCR